MEDEESIAENLTELLELMGYDVCKTVKNYQMAIEAFTQNDPDLIILDINIEGEKTGIDVAGYIKRSSNKPFIYHSGAIAEDMLLKAEATKPFAHFMKPTEFAQMQNTIEQALR